jgi:hypothetical protein
MSRTAYAEDPDDAAELRRRQLRGEICSVCCTPAERDGSGIPMHPACARQVKETVAREGYLHGFEERPPARLHWWSR